MSEKYNAVMERIEVTGEMRRRILDNVCKADIGSGRAAPLLPGWKRYLSLAACLAVVITGVLALPGIWGRQTEPPVQSVPGVDFNPSIDECPSAEALSQAVGFPVEDLALLPFEPNGAVYTSYWGELADIEYSGEGQSAVYRKSPGSEDNSGCYDDFEAEMQLEVGGITVTLRGTDSVYTLALWTDGAYAYSLSLSDGVAAAAWQDLIAKNLSS